MAHKTVDMAQGYEDTAQGYKDTAPYPCNPAPHPCNPAARGTQVGAKLDPSWAHVGVILGSGWAFLGS